MKRFVCLILCLGLVVGMCNALTLATQPIAGTQAVLNTTITSTTSASTVTFAYRAKAFACKGRDGKTFMILTGTATTGAYYTITASAEYKSPVGITVGGFSVMGKTVPSTLETIYYY